MNGTLKFATVERVKNSIARYLHDNKLKSSDVKNTTVEFVKGSIVVRVSFKNNSYHDFNLFQYKLNKKGSLFLGTTAVVTSSLIIGSLVSYNFKLDKEGNLAEKIIPKKEIVVENDFDNNSDSELSVSDAVISYLSNESADNYTIVESKYNASNDANSNVTYRDINTSGCENTYIPCYDYVMSNYGDIINKYGNRYGVDPSVIASLIMVECGNSKADQSSQHNYAALGLGQVNCKLFENQVFHIYDYETKTYEDYKFKSFNLEDNHDEQVKFIAIMLQYYSRKYSGNLNAMLVSYNQGMGTVSNIINKVIKETDFDSVMDVLNSENTTLISSYNTYKYGDPEYFNKVSTYLNYTLSKSGNQAKIYFNENNYVSYNVNTDCKLLDQSR